MTAPAKVTSGRVALVTGAWARSLLLVNRILTDRAFDRFLRLTYRTMGS
jgi:hypothetical protein